MGLMLILALPQIKADRSADLNLAGKLRFDRVESDFSGMKRGIRQAGTSAHRYEALITISDDSALEALRASGVEVRSSGDGVAVISFREDQASDIVKTAGLLDIQLTKNIYPQLDAARAFTGAQEALSGVGPEKSVFTGKGVIVGIVDNGFQYSHVAFKKADGTGSRISRVWDQNPEYGTGAGVFNYGVEYLIPDSIVKMKADVVNSTHGTHVAGIAAGSNYKGQTPYHGFAPDAEIVLVSAKGTVASAIDGIKYIFDYAEKEGKPCVVNLSLGLLDGPHDGTTATDRLMSSLTGPGRIIVTAAGNYGTGDYHVSHTSTYRKPALKTALSFNSYAAIKDVAAEIWGDVGHKCKIKAYVYDNTAECVLYETPVVSMNSSQTFTDEFKVLPAGEKDSLHMAIGLMPELSAANNRPSAYLRAIGEHLNKNRYYVCIEVDADGGEIHGWSNSLGSFTNLKNPDFTKGDNMMTISELGGNAEKIITVGSYVSKASFKYLGGSEVNYNYVPGTLAASSSQGPTFDGRFKPDVAAPGSVVVSSYSREVNGFDSSRMVYGVYQQDQTSFYGAMSGTSMASPAVTGIVATWLQAKPDLAPEDVKNILARTSQKDVYTGALPNNLFGAGKVSALEGLRLLASGDYSGVEDIETDDNEEARYYTLTGIALGSRPEAAGIYIMRKGSKATKIAIR